MKKLSSSELARISGGRSWFDMILSLFSGGGGGGGGGAF